MPTPSPTERLFRIRTRAELVACNRLLEATFSYFKFHSAELQRNPITESIQRVGMCFRGDTGKTIANALRVVDLAEGSRYAQTGGAYEQSDVFEEALILLDLQINGLPNRRLLNTGSTEGHTAPGD
jgi:hypothetical protein